MPGDTQTQQDGPPRGRERWKEETKAIERVIEVVITLEKPRTAGQIADEAMTSERTAREHLELLADELGVLVKTTTSGVTKYSPDAAYLRYKNVSGMVERHDRDGLMDRAETLKERIEDIREEYGVDGPDALRSQAAGEAVDIEEMRELEKVASEWDSMRADLSLVEEALEQYDHFDRGTAVV